MSTIKSTGSGLCQCGCGQATPLAKKTRTSIGHRKGESIPFVNGHNRRKQERYRVEDRGYRTPCHIWLLAKSQFGYGIDQGRQAHVVRFRQERGPIPDGYELDHLCRQHDCVNLDHLEPVTSAVNIQRGERAKLTPNDVYMIRLMESSGCSRQAIANTYGVCTGTIGAIIRQETWRNI